MKSCSLTRVLSVSFLFFVFTTPVKSALIFESTTGPFDSTTCCASLVSSESFTGARFTLTERQAIDGIGGHFSGLISGGSIFGAIVYLGDSGFPSATNLMLDNVIVSTLFTPTFGSDFLAPINVTLDAGSYAIVFGAGLLGATGSQGLTLIQPGQQTATSGSTFFSTNNQSWQDYAENRHRVLLSGTPSPVPVPASFWLFGTALIGLVRFDR